MKISSKVLEPKNPKRQHWFFCSKITHYPDRQNEFIHEGKWEYYPNEAKKSVHDEYSGYLNKMAIGDRAAIFELKRESSSEFWERHKIEIVRKKNHLFGNQSNWYNK